MLNPKAGHIVFMFRRQCGSTGMTVIRLERDDDQVRLITRGGNDWTRRYPCRGRLEDRIKQFVLDGEAGAGVGMVT